MRLRWVFTSSFISRTYLYWGGNILGIHILHVEFMIRWDALGIVWWIVPHLMRLDIYMDLFGIS